MNPYVQLVSIVWLLATVACAFTKDHKPIEGAFWFSLLAGLGYFLLN